MATSLPCIHTLALWDGLGGTGLRAADRVIPHRRAVLRVPFLGFGLGMILALLVALAAEFSDWIGVAWVAGHLSGRSKALESYVVTPRLVGERVGLHPVAVIFALAAFGQLFGFSRRTARVRLACCCMVASA